MTRSTNLNEAQTSLEFTGKQRKEIGMQKAVDHADAVVLDWSENCYRLLQWYVGTVESFMCENFRDAVKNKLPDPPHDRAFGSVIAKAARKGLITRIQYAPVKNPKANCAMASVWTAKQKRNV